MQSIKTRQVDRGVGAMSRPWLKLWTCALDKSKVMALPGDQFKVWTCLLMICERHSRDGLLPPLDDCAFMMHKGEEWLQPLVMAIVARGLIDETPDGLRMHDWLDWQTSKPSDEPERVRERVQRHRENKRANETPSNAIQHDTESSIALPNGVTPRNAIPFPVTPVTPKEEIREEENRLEEMRPEREDARGEPAPLSLPARRSRDPTKGRKVPLPDPFVVTDKMLTWAEGKNYDAGFIEDATEYFVNWARSHDHRYALWEPVWKNILDSRWKERASNVRQLRKG
jgi:hypothetical protein